jgi:hypothetical protein
MGFGCADSMNGGCSAYYPGLFKQIYFAAKQFKRYAANPTRYGHVPGIVNNVLFHPNSACGSSPVRIENKATAGLYNYTPYQPNGPALAAGYAAANNACSSYGNRNFWLYFTDWFGSTQTVGRDVDAPRGTLDAVSGGVSTISVRGWAYDPNVPTASITVHVYVDGRFSAPVLANDPRADVAQAYPGVSPSTGFAGIVPATPGKHTACVYAVNVGKGYTNPLLACRAVTVAAFPAHVPVGTVDTVFAAAGTVTMRGWAIDPDAPPDPLRVHVYVDGRTVGAVTANVARADVRTAYPRATANHGLEWRRSLAPGRHEICAYAINIGAGGRNPSLGCRTVVVGGPPVGVLEDVAVDSDGLQLTGWALDPDTVESVTVNVYVDGRPFTTQPADLARPDVETARPGGGSAHGFDLTLPIPAGARLVCVYANNLGSGSGAPRLGCWSGTIPTTAYLPVGGIDGATTAGTRVTVTGWALDWDVPADAIRVHIYVNGGMKEVIADRPHAQVAAQYPWAGAAHGWQATVALPSGVHELCAYGINVRGGASNPQLSCLSITVP